MGSNALIDIGLPVSLFLIMVGMGMTLTPKDFREVAIAPRGTFFGLLAQILLLPLIALGGWPWRWSCPLHWRWG